MTINYTGSVSFGSLRTEFGFSGSVKLSNYRIGGGYTANHENNISIPTTNSNLALSKWWRSDKDFESNAGMGYTGSAVWTTATNTYVQTSLSPSPTVTDTGWDSLSAFGTLGVIDYVGLSKSSTGTTNLLAIMEHTETIFTSVYYTYVLFSGNNTGTWWTSITVGSTTVNRTSANTATGFFDGVNTIWEWSTKPFGLTGPTTYVIRVTL